MHWLVARVEDMKLRTKAHIYLAVVAVGVLANLALWRYRRHLHELDTDYEREPLQHIQMILFRGTQAFLVVGALVLSWWKFFRKS